MRWERWALIAILVVGAVLRLAGAWRAPLELIEHDEFIPAAMTISWQHLPIRVAQHGALPVYAIRLGGLIAGNRPFGWRIVSVVAGTATMLILYLTAIPWWGRLPGLIAAALLAVDRYHVEISGRAIDLPIDLFFVALTMLAFSRFLVCIKQGREGPIAGRWLYLAAGACGLGFLCKELTAVMVPVMFLTFVLLRQTKWLLRREPWVALLLFAVVIAPDVYSNLSVTPAKRMDLWHRHEEAARQLGMPIQPEVYAHNGLYMSYGDQLSRFHGMGFNLAPFYFYFGDLFDALGVRGENTFDEFPYLNPFLGVLLWAGVAYTLLRKEKDSLAVFLLTMFCSVFLLFALLRVGPPRDVFPTDDVQLWYWVDRTMLAALLLTGSAVSSLATLRWPEAGGRE